MYYIGLCPMQLFTNQMCQYFRQKKCKLCNKRGITWIPYQSRQGYFLDLIKNKQNSSLDTQEGRQCHVQSLLDIDDLPDMMIWESGWFALSFPVFTWYLCQLILKVFQCWCFKWSWQWHCLYNLEKVILVLELV